MVCFVGCKESQPGKPESFSVKQLRADFQQLKTMLEMQHPMLYTNYLTTPTIEDYLKGTDMEMAVALDLIAKN